MKILYLLVAVAVAVAAENHPPHQRSDINIDELQDLTETLEGEVEDLAGVISDLTTLSSVADANINHINDFFLPRIDKLNGEQFDMIQDHQSQVKVLQHRVDDAKAKEKQALILAEATAASVESQINDFLNGSKVLGKNTDQQDLIDQLDYDIARLKYEFLDHLNDTIDHLEQEQEEAEMKLGELKDFVTDRKCEYGSTAVDTNAKVFVPFKTQFKTTPNVTITVTGFRTHVTPHSHRKGDDLLSLGKAALSANETGFFLESADFSSGAFEGKDIYCNWMACQNLGGPDIDLHA